MRIWAIGVLAAALTVAGCENGGTPAAGGDSDSGGPLKKLVIDDVKVGTGPKAKLGDVLLVEYVGKLGDGTKFDSTADHGGSPFQIELGVSQVIKGWTQGLVGIQEGGDRKLSIPASLAYGENSPSDKIPKNSDLFFEIKCDKLILADDKDNPVLDHFVLHGKGPKAKKGDTITIVYKGYFANGQVFDAGGQPFDFKIGDGKVVSGMDYGVIGRQVGDAFRLTIPPKWGYGSSGGPGGKDSWLIFDIKVIGLKH